VFLNIEQNKTFPISDKVKVNDNIIKVCPDHLKTPDIIKEKNYFFRLTKYQIWIEEFYKSNPDFVNPQFRYNEVIAFV
jgi:methionyl-tRNA synthetase